MSAWYWMERIIVPVVIGASVSAAVGWMPQLFMAPSFLRIVLVGLMCDATLVLLAWTVLLDEDERVFLKGHLGALLCRLRSKMS